MNLSEFINNFLSDEASGARNVTWLAKRAGMPWSDLSAKIRGKKKWTIKTIDRLAPHLHVSKGELMVMAGLLPDIRNIPGGAYIELKEALENPKFTDLMIRAWHQMIENPDFDLVEYLDRLLKVPQDQKAAILKIVSPTI